MNIPAIFNKAFGGQPNFITPDLEHYGRLNSDAVYELSSGDAVFGEGKIYGVTVLLRIKGKWSREHDLSLGGLGAESAVDYIKELKEKKCLTSA
jgi:hypothetical protein